MQRHNWKGTPNLHNLIQIFTLYDYVAAVTYNIVRK